MPDAMRAKPADAHKPREDIFPHEINDGKELAAALPMILRGRRRERGNDVRMKNEERVIQRVRRRGVRGNLAARSTSISRTPRNCVAAIECGRPPPHENHPIIHDQADADAAGPNIARLDVRGLK